MEGIHILLRGLSKDTSSPAKLVRMRTEILLVHALHTVAKNIESISFGYYSRSKSISIMINLSRRF